MELSTANHLASLTRHPDHFKVVANNVVDKVAFHFLQMPFIIIMHLTR